MIRPKLVSIKENSVTQNSIETWKQAKNLPTVRASADSLKCGKSVKRQPQNPK
jgi:hypothetical protein